MPENLKEETPRDRLPHDQRRARRPNTDKKLTRSRQRVLGGVAGGVAEYLNANPTAMRWGFGVVLIFSGGIFAIAYGLLWLLLPSPKPTSPGG